MLGIVRCRTIYCVSVHECKIHLKKMFFLVAIVSSRQILGTTKENILDWDQRRKNI